MAWLKKHWLRVAAHTVGLLPLWLLVWDYVRGQLFFDPVRDVMRRTGHVALALLVLSLACTPIVILSGWKRVMSLRRPLGLYAFLYALLHFLTFAIWDYALNLPLLWRAIAYQQFIVPGVIALLILMILAATSTKRAQQRLGKRWQWLHRSVYAAALLVLLHFYWWVKAPGEPLRYAVVIGILLILRLPVVKLYFKKRVTV